MLPQPPRLFSSDASSGPLPEAPAAEVHQFQSETKRILEIVTHSLYTERDVFLRELVSNASDALEKRRFKAAASGGDAGALEIRIATSADGATLTLEDSGVGMTRAEVMENLGTIAKSGTKAYLEKLAADGQAGGTDSLIGRFGVGFYASFMVADRLDARPPRRGRPHSPGSQAPTPPAPRTPHTRC